MAVVRRQVVRAATAGMPVLITGESGTGKNIVAQALHALSGRCKAPLVHVNCPSLPHTLIESELFGCEQGAFTGANCARKGKVEQAENGTLFLDEIGDLDIGVQSKLLQLLQDYSFTRLGGSDERAANVWIICATHRKLHADMDSGLFRSDLYYRINVVSIELPPLRERSGDVPLLLRHFLDYYQTRFACSREPISGSVLRLLESYHWPGNVRELENIVKRYVVLGTEEAITAALGESEAAMSRVSLAAHQDATLRAQTQQALRSLERQIILRALTAHRWNRRLTAQALGISYRALLYKIKETGLPQLRHKRSAA